MLIIPTSSAFLHLRLAFSLLLLPVFIFCLSQVPELNLQNAVLVFLVWHLFIYPASNGYNSYFDKDEGSIALMEHPPVVDKSLYFLSLALDVAGILIALLVNIPFAAAAVIYGLLSKAYSHPSVRLKKYPMLSFLVVFFFQGAFVYWTSYYAIGGTSAGWSGRVFLAGLICSCLIGASYPLTQVYQHAEDRLRGDKTLSILLGVKGSFIFSALLFFLSVFLIWIYWAPEMKPALLFIVVMLPVAFMFISLARKAWHDETPSYRQIMRITGTSAMMMMFYFLLILSMRPEPL